VRALVCGVLVAGFLATGPAAARDARFDRPLYVDPASQAALAARDDARFAPIARRAQALWLLDTHGVDGVELVARRYARAAVRAGRTPVVALYAIPARDCGSYSAGGLRPRDYRRWVRSVARGLRGTGAIAVVEPDALAMTGLCDGQGNRPRLLRHAVTTLTAAGAWAYLDAGHSAWHPPDLAADLLVRAGVDRGRGFVTNVANFQRTRDEVAWAEDVRAELRRRGVRRVRYAIDTSRNGAGPSTAEGWCNPSIARLGRRPTMRRGGARDGFLWVKRPGESDGDCGKGTPPAGHWWPDGALALTGWSPQ